MKRALVALTFVVVSPALGLLGTTAHAYVRQRTSHDVATHWASGCALVQPDSEGSPDLDSATVFSTVQSSMQAWRDGVQGCGYLTLTYVKPAPVEARYDGKNVIKFRTDKWCHPNDSQSNDVCYSHLAAGITSVFYDDSATDPRRGELLDTDVELNAVDFTFQVVDPAAPLSMPPRTGTQVADLENTLVHELGHVQGLDHTCADLSTPANEVDDSGNPPPSCSTLGSLPAAEQDKIESATMFNSATPGETKKRTPEADDVAGICAAYPIANDPRSCKAAQIKSCDAAPGGRSTPTALLVLGVVLVLRRRLA